MSFRDTTGLKKTWYLVFAALTVAVYFLVTNIMQFMAYQVIPGFIRFNPADRVQLYGYIYGVEIIISLILLIAVYMVYRKLKPKEMVLETKGLFSIEFLKSAGYGLALTGFGFVLCMLFSVDVDSDTCSDTAKLLMMLLTSIVFAPLIEEFLFRGIIYNFLSEFKSGWFAVITSSAVFAVYHFDVMQGILTFVMGIILAYAYWKTHNIKFPILIHGINNAMVCLTGSLLQADARPIVNWACVLILAVMVIVFAREVIKGRQTK